MTQFVFVTGGVVSSLGKGVAAGSLAAILESRGLSVTNMKLDPYLNVDPGTMSPFQHGEVFVTEDGAETDLDLGHYERFCSSPMRRSNNFTTGQIYENVIKKERQGLYLGKTVQVIPHVTDEIKTWIRRGAGTIDIAIVEIGGTVGDIESLPFLEAIRQMGLESPQDCCYIHVTLVPYIPSAREIKTKPTQHSVRDLREIGIQADILLCRSTRPISEDDRRKIALFCNLEFAEVIPVLDVNSVYQVPLNLHEYELDKLVCRHLHLNPPLANLSKWQELQDRIQHSDREVVIAMVGKYVDYTDSYISLNEALTHAGFQAGVKVVIQYIEADQLTPQTILSDQNPFKNCHAILVPGGFGSRGAEGKIATIQYAREQQIPYLGICLGMQLAVIEYARHKAGLRQADSTEFNPDTPEPVIALITQWQDSETGRIEQRDTQSKLGGTMRLGTQKAEITPGTKTASIYPSPSIKERHRHRYEVNNTYLSRLENAGLVISAKALAPDGKTTLCEMIELPHHPWFIGCQFHPEFLSRPHQGHPLFNAYIKAALDFQQKQSEKNAG